MRRDLFFHALAILSSCAALSAAQAHAATFTALSSGAWSARATWGISGADDDGIPDSDDLVLIRGEGLTVVLDGDGAAQDIRLSGGGTLRVEGNTPRWLQARLIAVNAGGHLVVRGAHRVTIHGTPGDSNSSIQVRPMGEAVLEGVLALDDAAVLSVEEGPTSLRLRLAGAGSRGLVGQRLKLRTGRGRLRSFDIVAQDGDLLTLAQGSAASAAGKGPFAVGLADPGGRHLRVPADIVDIDPRGFRDRLIQGRWLEWRDTGGEARLSFIFGAQDGGGEAPDRLDVWPPVEPCDAPCARVSWGVQPGDRAAVFMPLRLEVDPTWQLPADHPEARFGVYVREHSRVHLRRVDIEQGYLHLEMTQEAGLGTDFALDDLDIHHVASSCMMAINGGRGLRVHRLTARDIHPGTDLIEHGGIYQPADQRGHGLCVGRGAREITISDSLIYNTNDDGIIVDLVDDVEIRGNIVQNAGIFHGNSYEGISTERIGGALTIEGNIALQSSIALRLGKHKAGRVAVVRSNVVGEGVGATLLQSIDHEVGVGATLIADNLFAGTGDRVRRVDLGGLGAEVRDNVFLDAQLTRPEGATLDNNVLVRAAALSGPLIVGGPARARSNLFIAEGRAAVVRLATPDWPTSVEFSRNTFAIADGGAIALGAGPGAGRSLLLEANASAGPLLVVGKGYTSSSPGGAVTLRGNVTGGCLWQAPAPRWTGVSSAGNIAGGVVWCDGEAFVPADTSALFQGGALVAGYTDAGISQLSQLPIQADGRLRWSALPADAGPGGCPNGTDGAAAPPAGCAEPAPGAGDPDASQPEEDHTDDDERGDARAVKYNSRVEASEGHPIWGCSTTSTRSGRGLGLLLCALMGWGRLRNLRRA